MKIKDIIAGLQKWSDDKKSIKSWVDLEAKAEASKFRNYDDNDKDRYGFREYFYDMIKGKLNPEDMGHAFEVASNSLFTKIALSVDSAKENVEYMKWLADQRKQKEAESARKFAEYKNKAENNQKSMFPNDDPNKPNPFKNQQPPQNPFKNDSEQQDTFKSTKTTTSVDDYKKSLDDEEYINLFDDDEDDIQR